MIMTLQEKLYHIKQNMSQQLPESILNAFNQSLEQLLMQNLEKQALKEGEIAPDFTLLSSEDKSISLYDQLERNDNIVLTFFRGNWCPFCKAELNHYQQAINSNIINSATIIAISPQSIEFNRLIKQKNHLEFTVLSDQGNSIAKRYGLVFTLDENIREIYKNIGADLQRFNGDSSYQLPIPATYLINKSRKIIVASVNSNYMERADICDIVNKHNLPKNVPGNNAIR